MVELKNQGESLIHMTEKNLEEHGSKVGSAEKGEIENAVKALKDELATENESTIQSKIDDLQKAAMKLGEAIYKSSQEESAQAESGQASAGSSDAQDGEVLDAEFEEVNDKKE
jgi:molecular chaperone DnaK